MSAHLQGVTAVPKWTFNTPRPGAMGVHHVPTPDPSRGEATRERRAVGRWAMGYQPWNAGIPTETTVIRRLNRTRSSFSRAVLLVGDLCLRYITLV